MSGADELGPHVRTRLTYLLKRVFLELEYRHADCLAPYGLNARELAVLMLVDRGGSASQQQTAGRLKVDRTTMVALLDGLEGKGLVERQPDPADRRRNVVVLTTSGRRTLRDATAASDEAERDLLSGLSAADARRFRTLLQQVAESFDRSDEEP